MDLGIVYVFKSRFSTECKIGKTKVGNLSKRIKAVDKSNKGYKMRVAFFGVVLNTSKLEKRLHLKYKEFRKDKEDEVDGKTEFFNLYIWQRLECYCMILREMLIQLCLLLLLCVLLIIVLL